jgi:Helix-turn-helix domain
MPVIPATTRLLQPLARLVGIVRCLIYRDVRSVPGLTSAHLLTQFSVTPATSLGWFEQGRGGLVHEHPNDPSRGLWQAFRGKVQLSGIPTEPKTSWMPEPGAGYIVVLWPDAFQRLFGLEPNALINQTADAFEVLPAPWHDMLNELTSAGSPEQAMSILSHFLRPEGVAKENIRRATHPRVLHGTGSHAELKREWSSIAQQGRAWLEHLGLAAAQYRRAPGNAWITDLSERQIERRIKSFTGQSMRQWKTLVRNEEAFHLAVGSDARSQSPELSALAHDAGYADQAHMARSVKRLTGFSTAEFMHRYRHDDAFWLYRLWGG